MYAHWVSVLLLASLPACKATPPTERPGAAVDLAARAERDLGASAEAPIGQMKLLRAPVRLLAPTVKGPIAPDVVERVLAQRRRSMGVCYAYAVEAQPELKGDLSLEISFAPDGSLVGARRAPGGTLPTGRLDACLANQLEGLRLPSAGSPTFVSLPIQLGD